MLRKLRAAIQPPAPAASDSLASQPTAVMLSGGLEVGVVGESHYQDADYHGESSTRSRLGDGGGCDGLGGPIGCRNGSQTLTAHSVLRKGRAAVVQRSMPMVHSWRPTGRTP